MPPGGMFAWRRWDGWRNVGRRCGMPTALCGIWDCDECRLLDIEGGVDTSQRSRPGGLVSDKVGVGEQSRGGRVEESRVKKKGGRELREPVSNKCGLATVLRRHRGLS